MNTGMETSLQTEFENKEVHSDMQQDGMQSPSLLKDRSDSTSSEKTDNLLKKRRFVIEEIISTEKTYVDRLQAVVEVFIEPLRANNFIDFADLQGQFGFWETVTNLHKGLYGRIIESKAAGTLEIGKIFQDFSHFLKMYASYLANFEQAMDRRGILLTSNRRFADFVEKARLDPRCVGLGIESLLILPVQRIPRYRLLLVELLKFTPEDHSEYNAIAEALEKIGILALANNEEIRKRENKKKCMDVMMSFDTVSRINLLDNPARKYLKEGDLLRQTRFSEMLELTTLV